MSALCEVSHEYGGGGIKWPQWRVADNVQFLPLGHWEVGEVIGPPGTRGTKPCDDLLWLAINFDYRFGEISVSLSLNLEMQKSY